MERNVRDDPASGPTADASNRVGRRGWAGAHSRTASTLSGVLVVLMGLSAVAAALALWLHTSILDSGRFADNVEEIVSDPEITDPMGAYLTDQVFEALEVEERVERALAAADTFLAEQLLGLFDLSPAIEERLRNLDRPRIGDLAGPLVSSTRESVTAAVQGYLRSDEFQRWFPDVVERTHAAAVELIRNGPSDLPGVVVSAETVALDLTPSVAGAIQRLIRSGVDIIGFDPPAAVTAPVDTPEAARAWLEDTLGWQVPPDFARVPVMSTERLESLQWLVRMFDRFVWYLAGLTLVLGVGAVWAAPRKRRVVIQIPLTLVVAIVIVLVAVRRIEELVVEAFAGLEGRQTARAVLTSVLSDLRTIGIVLGVAGIAVAAVAFAVSRGRSGPAATEGVAGFVAAHIDGLRVAGGAAAAVALLIAGPSLGWVIVIGAVLIAYLGVLTMLGRGGRPDVPADLPSPP
jgi:hypothetical protein